MKQKSFLFVSVMALMSLIFTSCDKNKGDVLEGTWKNEPGWNSSTDGGGIENMEMTYVFDGKGKYTFTVVEDGYEWSSSKGTYVIEENNTLVCLHGISTNAEGISKEYDSELMLDLDSKPATLSAHLYDNQGGYYGLLVFVKQ